MTVIPNLLLRVQAQAKRRDTIAEQETQIQKTAYQLPKSNNTVLDKRYLKKSNSWQAHLTRISPYLIPGPGVWWSDLADSVEFTDGPEEADFVLKVPECRTFETVHCRTYINKRKTTNELLKKRSIDPSISGTCLRFRWKVTTHS